MSSYPYLRAARNTINTPHTYSNRSNGNLNDDGIGNWPWLGWPLASRLAAITSMMFLIPPWVILYATQANRDHNILNTYGDYGVASLFVAIACCIVGAITLVAVKKDLRPTGLVLADVFLTALSVPVLFYLWLGIILTQY